MPPSAVNDALDSPFADRVNRVGCPEPSVGTDHSDRSYAVPSFFSVATVNTALVPSGESASASTRGRAM